MEEQIKKTIETEKILIDPEFELIDVLSKIEESEAIRIILTFAEHSDVLISPINLKVILEVADENKKIVIAQIIQNVAGVRNAKDAGMVVTEATGTILDAYWSDAEKGFKVRMKEKEEKLQKKSIRTFEQPKAEVKTDEKEEKEIKPVSIHEPVKEASDFAKKIEATIERSKIDHKKQGKVVEANGITFALDQDIEDVNKQTSTMGSKINTKAPSLVGKDLTYFKADNFSTSEDYEKPKGRSSNKFTGMLKNIDLIPLISKISHFFSGIKTQKKIGTLLLTILIPLLTILGLTFWLIYTFAPLVKIKIYTESKVINVEKVFNGKVGTTNFSYEEGVIPVKKEELSREASGSTTPTGTAYRGTKAEGTATLKYWVTTGCPANCPSITIPAGTILKTVSGGLTYETLTVTKLGGTTNMVDWTKEVNIRAAAVGSEYNISSGVAMSVTGFNQEVITAETATSPKGGTKEAYTVFSQADMDKVVKDLKAAAFSDQKTELEIKKDGGWEIITSTVKQDLDGNPKSDIPVGGEGSIVNITIKVKTSAIYYKKAEIEDKIPEVITKSAQDQNLFNNDKGIQLQLDSDITKDIKIESVKNDIVKLTLKASGRIKPEVNKENIVTSLKGKNWNDGISKLNEYVYSSKKTELEFLPSYFPQYLRYFPNRQGRILITIEEINAAQ